MLALFVASLVSIPSSNADGTPAKDYGGPHASPYKVDEYSREKSIVRIEGELESTNEINICQDPDVECCELEKDHIELEAICVGYGGQYGGWDISQKTGQCFKTFKACYATGTPAEICYIMTPEGSRLAGTEDGPPCPPPEDGEEEGVCNNSVRNGCRSGAANDGAYTDSSDYYFWRCDGTGGGDNSGQCYKEKPAPPVDGVCNNASRNSCSSGVANDAAYADTGTHYLWRCDGENGGTNSGQCSKAKPPIEGRCDNTVKNGCSSGIPNEEAYSDTRTYYYWRCDGINGGKNSTQCEMPKPPVDGVCDNYTRNSCTSGTANDMAYADSSSYYYWRCDGENGGSDSEKCQKEIPAAPVNGSCNNSVRNGCSAGTVNNSAYSDSSTYYYWRCDGENGGSDSGKCQKEIPPAPVNGACNNSSRNSCSTGTANDSAYTDSSSYYFWRCDGTKGGSNSGKCKKEKPPAPVNGTCDNSIRNSCSSGNANDNAYADSSSYYYWRCDGENGGSDSGKCQKENSCPPWAWP